MKSVYNVLRAPGSFCSVRKLRRYSGRSEREAREFISKQDAYTLHRPRRIRFPRRKTCSRGIADLFQIDLVDDSSLSSHNDGMRYILTCIDVFSKRAWAVPLRTMTGRDVTQAFEQILSEQKCSMVQGDKEAEFMNSTFQSMLRERGIKFYTSENEDIKAAVVEPFNRTLKTKMFRYFTHENTRRYVNALPDLIHS